MQHDEEKEIEVVIPKDEVKDEKKDEKEYDFKAVIENNQKLINNVTNLTKKVINNIDKKEQKESPIDNELSKIESKIKELKEVKLEAMKNLDHDKVLEYDELLQDLKLRQKELMIYKSQLIPEPDSELVEAVEQFRQEFSWYDEDPIMEAAMNKVDAINANSAKWKGKPIIERLRAGAAIVESRFNMNKSQNNLDNKLSKLYNQVETKSYSNVNKHVKIPAIHKTLSEGFGIPLEEIVKEMN